MKKAMVTVKAGVKMAKNIKQEVSSLFADQEEGIGISLKDMIDELDQRYPPGKCSFQEATWYEGVCAMVLAPRCETGGYKPKPVVVTCPKDHVKKFGTAMTLAKAFSVAEKCKAFTDSAKDGEVPEVPDIEAVKNPMGGGGGGDAGTAKGAAVASLVDGSALSAATGARDALDKARLKLGAKAVFSMNQQVDARFKGGRWEPGTVVKINKANGEIQSYDVKFVIDVNEPWGRHFNAFAPGQEKYYFVNVGKAILGTFVLNVFKPFPALQSAAMLSLELWTFFSVLHIAPYTLVAQTRSELMGAAGKCVTYGLALLPALGLISAQHAAAVIVNASFVSIGQNVFTSLYPMIEKVLKLLKLLYNAYMKLHPKIMWLVKKLSPPFVFMYKKCSPPLIACCVACFAFCFRPPLKGGLEPGDLVILLSDDLRGLPAGEKGMVEGRLKLSERVKFPADWRSRVRVLFKNGLLLCLRAEDVRMIGRPFVKETSNKARNARNDQRTTSIERPPSDAEDPEVAQAREAHEDDRADFVDFLTSVHLAHKAWRFFDHGVESVADAADEHLLSDKDLAEKICLSPDEVALFRETIKHRHESKSMLEFMGNDLLAHHLEVSERLKREKEEFLDFLALIDLDNKARVFFRYGVETMADALDESLVTDQVLATEFDLSAPEITVFRREALKTHYAVMTRLPLELANDREAHESDVSKKREELLGALAEIKLEKKAQRFFDYGIESIEDAWDEDLLTDQDLAEDIQLSPLEIERLRRHFRALKRNLGTRGGTQV